MLSNSKLTLPLAVDHAYARRPHQCTAGSTSVRRRQTLPSRPPSIVVDLADVRERRKRAGRRVGHLCRSTLRRGGLVGKSCTVQQIAPSSPGSASSSEGSGLSSSSKRNAARGERWSKMKTDGPCDSMRTPGYWTICTRIHRRHKFSVGWAPVDRVCNFGAFTACGPRCVRKRCWLARGRRQDDESKSRS
ncbi:hypothetical protein FA95DRAFT_1093268 [Auriscalpium vulgare]|uniref:Uncharacterized protein n=1 Tax=Auriscalpium vulgare TaxID=40419 RepID=A0ACB8R585_9AGAM|nr:hypothetical protein FA95DRAFT_1093268 [Auriscalpium vulgare]